MIRFVRRLRAHPHFLVATGVGIVAALLASGAPSVTFRWLVGWNVGVWLYLVWTGWTMTHQDAAHLEKVAKSQAEGASTVLAIVAAAALSSFGAVILELAAAKSSGGHHALPNILLTLVTVVGSWLMLPTLFSLNYASLFHAAPDDDGGLRFPDAATDFTPEYIDFLYFSFTIAVASQTSDVVVTNRPMRRLVLLQSVLSFVFNTTVLAFSINIAASLF